MAIYNLVWKICKNHLRHCCQSKAPNETWINYCTPSRYWPIFSKTCIYKYMYEFCNLPGQRLYFKTVQWPMGYFYHFTKHFLVFIMSLDRKKEKKKKKKLTEISCHLFDITFNRKVLQVSSATWQAFNKVTLREFYYDNNYTWLGKDMNKNAYEYLREKLTKKKMKYCSYYSNLWNKNFAGKNMIIPMPVFDNKHFLQSMDF